MTKEQRLPEPTRCYIDGCDRENELMLHVADDPWLGGDYCMEHARAIVASTPLIVTCECPICARARRVVSDGCPEATLAGPGSWCVITETSSYVLDLDAGGTGTLVRRAGTGQGFAPEAVDLPPPLAVELRRDGESIPVHWAEVPVVGRPWTLLLDVRRDGLSTLRRTTIVRQIVVDNPVL
jgi:hypothetical protein